MLLGLDAASLKLIMKIGPLPDALDPGFHGAWTPWNPGFMAFQMRWRTRIVRRMVLEW